MVISVYIYKKKKRVIVILKERTLVIQLIFCTLQNNIEDRRRMQEEHEAPAAKRVCRSGSVSITLADSDVLDCPICFGPFRPPVYQVCLFLLFCFAFFNFQLGLDYYFLMNFFFKSMKKIRVPT